MSSTRSVRLPAILAEISQLLATRKKKNYIVGGFIRDRLLKSETNDIDIAGDGNTTTIARKVVKEIGGTFVLLDDVNNIARVVVIQDRRPAGSTQEQKLPNP